MPVGAIIGGVASIGGALLGASATKKAANSAADAQTQATAQQLTLGRETNALQKQIYDQNFNLLNPFVQRGNAAGGAINDLLGIGGGVTAPAPAAGAVQAGGLQGGTTTTAPRTWQPKSQAIRSKFGLNELFDTPVQTTQPVGQPVAAQPIAAPAQTPEQRQAASRSAFENFANSAGMQFQLDQGRDMIEHAAAGRGALQSGAAMKSLQDYGQQTAIQNYFMPYMSLLGGQQAVGAQAGSAVAGVGSDYGRTVAGVNAGMGGNIQNGANALSNAALLRGQANAQMWNGIAGGLGGMASSFGGGIKPAATGSYSAAIGGIGGGW